ncbi:MAG: radical SAM family heme chaperone HemW [Candidatus Sulfotelmatobacter sp.]|jgi:putative oxygen-independent coproporphyrinogen III oxidase
MSLGVYVSVPFCRTKCSYCNFASDVFSRAVFDRYVDRVCADIGRAPQIAAEMGGQMERTVDSIYLGGGTPTVLEAAQLERIFAALSARFNVEAEAEITAECAPGTLTATTMESLLCCGVNRVSLGVQSFVDEEAAAVGRLHKRTTVLEDIARLRAAGITNINIDLIAGLPHQTAESWEFSLAETIAIGVPHVSVYMLEVDEDSRLGRELLAGGKRYHAHFVPDEESVADFYLAACERLAEAGIAQYEISNFAREGFESRHNLKYWTRLPYFGFGVDAHSMLASATPEIEAVRFASADSLEQYVSGAPLQRTVVSNEAALEESFFLGLRLMRGINLRELATKFGDEAIENTHATVVELVEGGLMERRGDSVHLTSRGRLLSNEVFERFLEIPATAAR